MFTKLENPIFEIRIETILIIIAICMYCFLFLATLFKKLFPKEIAVVKMDANITNPYPYFRIPNILDIT